MRSFFKVAIFTFFEKKKNAMGDAEKKMRDTHTDTHIQVFYSVIPLSFQKKQTTTKIKTTEPFMLFNIHITQKTKLVRFLGQFSGKNTRHTMSIQEKSGHKVVGHATRSVHILKFLVLTRRVLCVYLGSSIFLSYFLHKRNFLN